MIHLEGTQPIVRGGHRLCYGHPHHPDRCIKIMIPRPHSSPQAAGRRLASLLHLRSEKNENELDLEAYQELERWHDPAIWNHIPRCHGLVETDLGIGLVTDYLRGPDGGPAPTLHQRIKQDCDADCRRAIEEFKEFLLEHLIRVGDLRPKNLLICSPPGSQQERIFIIDGLGNLHPLWWRCFLPLRRYKVRRKIRRLEQRIEDELASKPI